MWLACCWQCSRFHFNFNSGEIPRGGVLGKTVHVTHAGVTFTCVRRAPLSHTGVLQKLYEFFSQILFLSETGLGLVSLRRVRYRLFWGFLFPVYSPKGSGGFSCFGNRRFGSGIKAVNMILL